MSTSEGELFKSLESSFTPNAYSLAETDPFTGLIYGAYGRQKDLRDFQEHLTEAEIAELGKAGAKQLNEHLETLDPSEMRLTFTALRAFTLLQIEGHENIKTMYDFGGIHWVSGQPHRFMFAPIYSRPTIALSFVNSEFLSPVEELEINPNFPTERLAIPVFSIRVDGESDHSTLN